MRTFTLQSNKEQAVPIERKTKPAEYGGECGTLQPQKADIMVAPKHPGRVISIYHPYIHLKIRGIEEFLLWHADTEVSWNHRKVAQLEALQSDLRAQFQRMEMTWDDMKANPIHEPVFDKVEMCVNTAEVAVTTTLLESESFLEARETPAQALNQDNWVDMAPATEPTKCVSQLGMWLELAKKKEAREAEGASLLSPDKFLDPDGAQVPTKDRPRSAEACPQSPPESGETAKGNEHQSEGQQGCPQPGESCSRCGGSPHLRDQCPAAEARSFRCNIKGHFQRACETYNHEPHHVSMWSWSGECCPQCNGEPHTWDQCPAKEAVCFVCGKGAFHKLI